MQTTKFLFVIGTAAILVAPLSATAGPDNEAQAKMREALRQKMEALNAQSAPAPAPVAPPVVEPVKPVPAPVPAPAPAPKPTVKTPTEVVPVPAESSAPVSSDAALMREALRQKMEALNAQAPPATAPVTPPPVAAPMPAKPIVRQAPVAPAKASKSDAIVSGVTDPTEEAKAARLREALHQKMATAPQPAPVPIVSAPARPTKPTTTVVAPVFSAPPTANLPASPFTGSKQERLAELLSRYKADIITPMEYHTQRAKIIAEP